MTIIFIVASQEAAQTNNKIQFIGSKYSKKMYKCSAKASGLNGFGTAGKFSKYVYIDDRLRHLQILQINTNTNTSIMADRPLKLVMPVKILYGESPHLFYGFQMQTDEGRRADFYGINMTHYIIGLNFIWKRFWFIS